MVTRSKVELLGGLRVEQGERIITRFRTQKTGALLAHLAYYRERSHPREQLIEMLWPESELASGRNGLSIALSSLRHQLEPPGVPHGAIIRADRFSVQLNPEAVTTDVAEFEAALQKAAQAGSTSERILFLADAAELYTGELLPGYFEEWCLTERDRLAETYLGALHQLVELLERTGDLDRALGYARRAVSADPLREEGYHDVMRLLAAAGQPTAALRQYRELEERLDDQLGQEPSGAARRLAQDIERQTAGQTTVEGQAEGAKAAASPRASALPARRPTGTVTFLLTDVERSTAQWEKASDAFPAALASHHSLLRRTFRRFGGCEVKETGDGFLVAFERAGDALACAVAGQSALAEHPWPKEAGSLRVRMALHTGDIELQEGEYRGLVLHHASRMLAAAHGGQILCSEATAVVAQRSLEPGIRLTDLGVYRLRDVEAPERLFQVEYPDMTQRVFPPLRAEAGYARNLPLQFTRFVGRERELGQLEELLLAEPTRLVTMTGPGGTGKSRLALELASRLLERFSGAVWFVALADLSDPRRIVDAVLDALRLPRSPSLEPLEQVVEMLSRQPSLLVLDNFEHLVEEGAPVVRALLERVPSLTCLVTSRQRLDLSGEQEFVVPPLQTPASGGTPEQLSMYESVQLFIDRAQAVKPDFQVTNQNAPAVAELCNRLEGSPLAIELAAARAQILTPSQMLNQLAHRFHFLVSRRRDGAKRHQTLHAAVDWSYQLLAPELQRFFARLSVFRGGWTLEAAEAVCAEPLALDYLAQLRECSLVLAEEDGDQTRFRMLETLREYAAEQLEVRGEMAALHRQHADFFVALAEEAAPKLHGSEEMAWLDRLEREHDNLRAALAWTVEQSEAEAGLRLVGSLWRFWLVRGHLREGRWRLGQVLALAGTAARTATRAKALNGAGLLAWAQGDYAGARSRLEESLAIWRELGDRRSIAGLFYNLGVVAREQGDHAGAQSLHEESLAIQRELGQQGEMAYSLRSLGRMAQARGDYAGARSLLEESLAICRELDDRSGIAYSLKGLGSAAQAQGDRAAARSLWEESLAILRKLGHKLGIADSLDDLGTLARDQEDYGAALALYEESLEIERELGDPGRIVIRLEGLAAAAGAHGQGERAARIFGAAEGLREAMGATLTPADRAGYDRSVAAARTALGEEGFAAAWTKGRAMTWEQATAYALDESDTA